MASEPVLLAVLGRAFTADDAFGWWLHGERAQFRRSVEVARGIGAALSDAPLGREWFDAVAGDESQVDEMMYQTNADRRLAAIKAKLGWTG